MAKTLKMRPIWICLKLCRGDTKAATFLAEVLFRSNITIYKNGNNPVIVFSIEEWSDIIGLSVKQARVGMDRAANLKLIRKYNDKHPFKSALRALHLEVPAQLAELYRHMTAGEYWFEGEVLRLSASGAADVNISLLDYAPESTPECTTIVTPIDTQACPQGASPHIYKKENKKEKVSAFENADSLTILEEKEEEAEGKKEEEKTEDEAGADKLADIPSFYEMLTALYDHYTEYQEGKKAILKKANFNAYDAGKIWKQEVAAASSEWSGAQLGGKEYKLLKNMLAEFTPEDFAKLVHCVISQWSIFTLFLSVHDHISFAPKAPAIGFFYKFRHHAVKQFLVQNDNQKKVKTLADAQSEMTIGDKKLAMLKGL